MAGASGSYESEFEYCYASTADNDGGNPYFLRVSTRTARATSGTRVVVTSRSAHGWSVYLAGRRRQWLFRSLDSVDRRRGFGCFPLRSLLLDILRGGARLEHFARPYHGSFA